MKKEQEQKYYAVKVVMQLEKKVTEQYLVDAVSVTDAEVKVTKDFEGVGFDYTIKSVVETNIVKVLQ